MRAWIIFAFFAATAYGQMREVGGKVYNLAPLIAWNNACLHDPNWRTATSYPPSPMQDWEILPSCPFPMCSFHASVYQVIEDGVIVKVGSFYGADFQSSPGGHLEFIKHLPISTNLADGDVVNFAAKRIGIYRYGVETIPAYDYGKPWTPPPPPTPKPLTAEEVLKLKAESAAKKAAGQAKAFKYWTEQAEAGDATAARRLGEMYRDGEGTPRDVTKARVWLTHSAQAGDKEAVRELAAIDAQK